MSALPRRDRGCKLVAALASLSAASLLFADPAHAYIGPGAGFAFLGSTFVFILAFLMFLATALLWPLQYLVRRIAGKGISKRARARRVVIVGLDGLDPGLAERYMEEGRLPHLKELKSSGSYSRLGTTLPALSPVAWSTFQTGVNPGAHNIFDFLTRDKRFCMPLLSSTETGKSSHRFQLGALKLFKKKAEVRLLRKSQPFWKILGSHGVFSNVLRVPISYPPEKFHGNILSGMCTPDLKGTQGMFALYTTRAGGSAKEGGELHKVELEGSTISTELYGPPDPASKKGEPLELPFSLELNRAAKSAELRIGGIRETLTLGEFSPWIKVEFRAGRNRVSGICRFCLREVEPEISLYVSPINVDPEEPALPISEPLFFSTYLAKKQGPFGTLGLLEDTWGRNELALDDKRFLEQTYLTHAERETMFLEMLDKTREGVCLCVFDASDRVQHMFWRYIDDRHPSPREDEASFGATIPEMYSKMDDLVGRVKAKLSPEDVLIVLSDHGFSSFRRCVNLNTWLWQNGYLALKEGAKPEGDYFREVDWSRTEAFALGLSGIYVNRRGREVQGIVDNERAEQVKKEIVAKLQGLEDPRDGQSSIRKIYDTAQHYRGLYTDEAPDLIVGYEPGYRVSWDSITGGFEPEVFSDNLKAWSGDHHVDPEAVPGILFMNRPLKSERPHIADIAPTLLDLFAIKVPGYMEGKVLL